MTIRDIKEAFNDLIELIAIGDYDPDADAIQQAMNDVSDAIQDAEDEFLEVM